MTKFAYSDSVAQFLCTMEMLNAPFEMLGESEFGGVFTCYGPRLSLPKSKLRARDEVDITNDATLLDRAILEININIRVEYGN